MTNLCKSLEDTLQEVDASTKTTSQKEVLITWNHIYDHMSKHGMEIFF